MFKLAQVKRAIDELRQTGASGAALALDTPVRFDGTLVRRLVAEHGELNQRFAALVRRLDANSEGAEQEVRDCASRLHDLRRTEALWLYPVIARGIARDPVARRQFLQLRLVMLGLARRALRLFDELSIAINKGSQVAPTAEQAGKALAEYRQRNEAEIYPLYDLIGQHAIGGRHVA